MKKIIILLFLSLTIIKLSAQDTTPKVSGKIEISIKKGTIEGDLILSDIPAINDYLIRLNSGLNILHFRSLEPSDFLLGYNVAHNDTLTYGESKAYYFPDNTRKNKFLPNSIQVKYVAKYPVIKDTLQNYSQYDWKGNIAFNHNSIRTDGLQSAWYPILYDISNDIVYHKVKYDIEITCNDCTTLYINGNRPIKAQKHRFKSEIARELTLFCGNYDFSNVEDTYILNPNLTNKQINDFTDLINSYKKFYTNKLEIPFDQSVSFIETTPTSKKNGWLFVSYPTIVNIGWGDNGLKSLFNPQIQNWYRPFIAHELGHYYFGTYKVFNSELGDMISEGFAEFLSLELTKEIIGTEVYESKMAYKVKELDGFSPISIGKIKGESDYNDRELYVYYYAPIVFTAIEKEIGKEKMWNWIKAILKTETNFTDYEFLISTLRTALNNKQQIELIENQYLISEESLKNALERIKQK